MGSDIDLQDDRILGSGEVVEGLAASGTPAPIGCELVILDEGREVGIVTPLGTGLTGLLTSGPTRWRVGRWLRVGTAGSVAAAVSVFRPKSCCSRRRSLSLEVWSFSVLSWASRCEGAAMLGLPVGGLSPGLELLVQAWADRTGALGDGRCGAEGIGRRLVADGRGSELVQLRGRERQGSEAKDGGQIVIHGGRV